MNQYEYMENYLDSFWIEIFGKNLKETFCSGIISAHGDKCYQYRKYWQENEVPFNHGCMIYMLTYTNLLDRPKHLSKEFVVEMYHRKYKEIIIKLEKNI